MASSNLDSFFKIINEAEKGEAVRDAIINAAKNMNVVTNNVGTLGGVPASEYASANTLSYYISEIRDRLLLFDTEEDYADATIASVSEHIMSSGSIYELLNSNQQTSLRSSLLKMMNFETDPVKVTATFEEAYKYYVKQLNEAKNAIGMALISKGKDVTDKDVKNLKDYARLIREIGDKEVKLIDSISITQIPDDGKQDAGKTSDGKLQAYKKVEVNISSNKTRITTNGTHTAPEGKPWTEVEVAVSTNKSGGSSGRLSGKGGVDVTDENMLTTIDITENGEYPPPTGAAGYKVANVHVTVPDVDPNQTFEVVFYDGTSDEDEELVELGRCTVPAYGSAYLENAPATKEKDGQTLYFTGWNPIPFRVLSNMRVGATWTAIPPAEGNEITDSWETIVSNKGTSYKIHDYKTFHLAGGGIIVMEKVGNGRDSGSGSTWISKNVPSFTEVSSGNFRENWATSTLRTFLNGDFIEQQIRASSEMGAALLADSVVPVKKYSFGIYSYEHTGMEQCFSFGYFESNDRIWIPSFREMFGPIELGDDLDKYMKYYYNGKNPTNGEYDSGREPRLTPQTGPSLINEGGINMWEVKGPVYDEAFGSANSYTMSATDLSTHGQPWKLAITPVLTNTEWYKKKDATNSSYTGYYLRTVCGFDQMYDGRINTFYCVDENGQAMAGNLSTNYPTRAPIGFCL